jgi:hypothetical protein
VGCLSVPAVEASPQDTDFLFIYLNSLVNSKSSSTAGALSGLFPALIKMRTIRKCSCGVCQTFACRFIVTNDRSHHAASQSSFPTFIRLASLHPCRFLPWQAPLAPAPVSRPLPQFLRLLLLRLHLLSDQQRPRAQLVVPRDPPDSPKACLRRTLPWRICWRTSRML